MADPMTPVAITLSEIEVFTPYLKKRPTFGLL